MTEPKPTYSTKYMQTPVYIGAADGDGPARRARWEAAAAAEGLTLGRWLASLADRACSLAAVTAQPVLPATVAGWRDEMPDVADKDQIMAYVNAISPRSMRGVRLPVPTGLPAGGTYSIETIGSSRFLLYYWKDEAGKHGERVGKVEP